MKKNVAPILLSVVSVVGVFSTTALAVKATPKAMKILKEKEEKLSVKEVVKATWKCYIPTAISAAVTVGCIAGAGILSERRITAITAAYGVLENTYKNYISKVKEMLGEETHREILKSIAAERATQENITAEACCCNTSLGFEGADEEEYLFYDQFGDRYFTSTISSVLQAEYHLNRNFCLGGHVTLNDFYEFLGIEKTKTGDTFAWSSYDCDYYWIDFDHTKAKVSDDGLECYIISMVYPPEALKVFLEPNQDLVYELPQTKDTEEKPMPLF